MRPASLRSHSGRVLRCLIVDDNPHFLRAARVLLEREGAEVVGEASTGTDAIERIRELRPDVTLLDINLGAESGFEVARRIREQADQATSPVILISSSAEQDYADLIEASPSLGFLAKSDLSARAVRDLLEGLAEGGRESTVTEPPGT
jgi:DNA-binding NarL/FixJ family response regulator